jgi:hypothetical protein
MKTLAEVIGIIILIVGIITFAFGVYGARGARVKTI